MSEFKEENENVSEYGADTEQSAVNSPDADTDEEKEPHNIFSEVLDWALCVIYAVVAVLALNMFFFRSITVSGDSMNDTLTDKDFVLTTNFMYKPQYGDIVILQADKLRVQGSPIFGETIIKRVIATGGDTIRVDFEKGIVYRNGEALEEDDYIKEHVRDHFVGWMESNKEYTVPENCVFVMGDNRNHSNDSRNLADVGFIDVNYIMGKALVRYAPFSKFKWL